MQRMRKRQKYQSGKAYDSVNKKNGTALVVKIERRRWVVDAREELPSLRLVREPERARKETKGKRHGQKQSRKQEHGNYSRNSADLIRACLGSWPR